MQAAIFSLICCVVLRHSSEIVQLAAALAHCQHCVASPGHRCGTQRAAPSLHTRCSTLASPLPAGDSELVDSSVLLTT